jgi:hypothetical protein
MQVDMHYYGTYAIARAAGMKPEIAETVATAAQYVDDSNTADFALKDGSYLYCPATGHHPVDAHNIDNLDQRLVWIPYHFLPGNEGRSLNQRLICRKDSDVARDMLAHVLEQSGKEFGIMLVGIAAHVYADTFAHYGFSGVSAIENQVNIASIDTSSVQSLRISAYIKQKADRFLEKFGTTIANEVALGHGGVATHPDRPYLSWSFRYNDGRDSGVRNNQNTFLEASERLYEFFQKVIAANPTFADDVPPVPFEQLRSVIKEILSLEGELPERITAWREAMVAGKILTVRENIPEYDCERFSRELATCEVLPAADVKGLGVYRFLRAANAYRTYVLDELLPAHGMQVFMLHAA